tara:strand:+ start:1704 stop:2732 length:1029 start_codon:yes stop_codon:yes gene_type:complete
MKIIVTGAAGFIGFHSCLRLIKEKYDVIGIDNINSYYDINLKISRINELNKLTDKEKGKWNFFKVDLEEEKELFKIFNEFRPNIVLHLAAQAGVRYSIEQPKSYINSNLIGFFNIIELCRKFDIKNFIYASSSSVYGGNKRLPFSEVDSVDHPISLYAATKKSNEVIAHCYSHLYGIPTTGLRFFTVYGPWGRPDMAPIIFAKAIAKNIPIKIFNYGKMKRDFTYIDDIVESIFRCCKKTATTNIKFDRNNPEPSTSYAPFRIFNLGNSKSIELMKFINYLEEAMGKEAIKEYLPIQPGDVEETAADTSSLEKWINFAPNTPLEKGIKDFTTWFKNYYKLVD